MFSMFDFLNSFTTGIVIILLGVSTVIGVLDYIGFLPPKVKKWLRLNRAEETLQVLNSFGIDIEKYRRHNNAADFPRLLEETSIKETTQKELDKYKIPKSISVGHHRVTKLDYYYDVIGGTCDSLNAEYFAKILSSHWSVVSKEKSVVSNPYFDFVVTPKAGSPLLGYEFAKLCNKPLILHEDKARFNDNFDDMRRWFDCYTIPEEGTTALLVDDSVTGASMMESAVKHLREYNYKVNTCLVVFEVCAKNGRVRLKDNGIDLIEVVKTHT